MESIRQMIAKGQLREALNELADNLPSSLKKSALALQDRLRDLEMREIGGVLSFQERNLIRNQIVNAALGLCDMQEPLDASGRPPEKPTYEGGSSTKILFLAANPTDQARLQTDREFKIIRERIRAATHRQAFKILMPEISLTVEELVRAMNQKPQIVHFSGHAAQQGIFITNAENESHLMAERPLKRLFRQHQDSIQLVILNSCYSATQARLISTLGIYVIGMGAKMSDLAAIALASGMYIGLGEGKSVEQAFDDAMIILETKYPQFASLPEIWKDGEQIEL